MSRAARENDTSRPDRHAGRHRPGRYVSSQRRRALDHGASDCGRRRQTDVMFLDESWAFEKSDCSSPMEVDMPEVERYEILVIGSADAGKHVTWTFAQAGHRTAVVEGEVQAHLDRFKATGAELVRGEARFVASKTVEVQLNEGGRRMITGDRVFLDLGSRAAIPDIPGLAAARPMTHVEA